VALDLKEPKIKQAPNDTSLDPLEAQNALTSVINYDGMLVGDKIIVRWTGAPGTPAAGSHTTEPWPVTTVGPQEIPLAVSVLAFNLAKSITLDYTVTRGTQDPKESRIRALAVSPIAQSDLPGPLIVQASEQGEGPELDVSQLTTNATLRANSYPHIALRQYVWLKAKGTLKGGGDYSKTFWQPPGSQTNATWIDQGFHTHDGFPLPDLQSLEDGSDLELKFKAGFGGSQVETEAVTFALRTYRIKAYENVVPTLDSVKGSPSGEEIPHGGLTMETTVTLRGVAAKGQKVEIFDGTVSEGQARAHATTGGWTLLVSALAVAAHSFTVKALYGSGAVSAARTLTVLELGEDFEGVDNSWFPYTLRNGKLRLINGNGNTSIFDPLNSPEIPNKMEGRMLVFSYYNDPEVNYEFNIAYSSVSFWIYSPDPTSPQHISFITYDSQGNILEAKQVVHNKALDQILFSKTGIKKLSIKRAPQSTQLNSIFIDHFKFTI
jgi:hypothetical protein